MSWQADEVKPTYVQTAVRPSDPAALREHHVVALSHENGISDQMKLLRTRIRNHLKTAGGNSILVTSVGPGEGKTFTAVNLAVSFSHEVNQTILLIDADLRTPSVHRCFGLEAGQGLADYLLRGAPLSGLLVNPGLPRLTLLPAGTPVSNSTELLGAPQMGALVEEMKKRYADRFLVFDGSPVLTSADALVFSRLVDGVVLVVEAERTARRDLRRALEILTGVPLLGLVVNKLRDLS